MWRVIGLLGTGAWSRVYQATRTEPCLVCDRCPVDVAVKVVPLTPLPPTLRAAYTGSTEGSAEGSTDVAPACHPGLVRTFHRFVGTDYRQRGSGPVAVLIMERALRSVSAALAAGISLADGPLLGTVCDAMAALHRAGWLHGNLTCDNVLLMADGTVRIADLDHARPIRGGRACVPAIGSADYLPPEWWRSSLGESGVYIGQEHDIWAYGILAHRVLTGGRHPFAGDRASRRSAAIRRYGRGRAYMRLAPAIPPPWRAIIADCLQADPVERAAITFAELRGRLP